MNEQIFVYDDLDSLNKALICKWKDLAQSSISKKGKFSVALSGGKTPIRLYQELSNKKEMPWNKTHVFFTDERFVSIIDKENSFSMIKENLFSQINIPDENIHQVDIKNTISESATQYEEKIKNFFSLDQGDFPRFDLIILGIGEDGHTAALFKDKPQIEDLNYVVVQLDSPKKPSQRISLKAEVISNAENIIFLVTGGRKAGILKKIINDKYESPARSIIDSSTNVIFYIDKEAASNLSSL